MFLPSLPTRDYPLPQPCQPRSFRASFHWRHGALPRGHALPQRRHAVPRLTCAVSPVNPLSARQPYDCSPAALGLSHLLCGRLLSSFVYLLLMLAWFPPKHVFSLLPRDAARQLPVPALLRHCSASLICAAPRQSYVPVQQTLSPSLRSPRQCLSALPSLPVCSLSRRLSWLHQWPCRHAARCRPSWSPRPSRPPWCRQWSLRHPLSGCPAPPLEPAPQGLCPSPRCPRPHVVQTPCHRQRCCQRAETAHTRSIANRCQIVFLLPQERRSPQPPCHPPLAQAARCRQKRQWCSREPHVCIGSRRSP